MAFAENLKHLMDIEGLSKYKLAKILGCHQTTVQNWLDGSVPQKRTQKSIASAFGISVDELMGDTLPVPRKEKKPIFKEEGLTDLQRKTIELVMTATDEELTKTLFKNLMEIMGER